MRSASRMLLLIGLTGAVAWNRPACGVETHRETAQDPAPRQNRSPGRRAAEPAREPSRFSARWVGQDGQDWTGLGPSVGGDGLQDAHIALGKLASGVAVKAIRVEGTGKVRWEFGMNRKLNANAELIRDAKNPPTGELYFQPDHDLNGERLRVILAYQNDKIETTTVVAGPCDAGLWVPRSPLPKFNESALTAQWLGQDGSNPGSAGDVHVAVTGWPAATTIVGGALSDAVRQTWMYRLDSRATIPDDPSALPLLIKPRAGGTSVDLFFAPYRDESKETLTLRLMASDGQDFLVRFPGGSADLSRLAARPASTRVEAKPGDDLQALAEKFGTIVLTPGTYLRGRPLVLNRPVTITSEGGATVLFAQGVTEPAWSSAIKIHCGNTTLNGFSVRFAGRVRWKNDISWGPAVIGMTDELEPHYNDPKWNLKFTRLDLEVPLAPPTSDWPESLRLMRLVGARNGVIAGNTLVGGPIEFFDGPWHVLDNDSRGTAPGTYSHEVFGGRGTHDIIVRGNRARDLGQGGKTWRFMALSGRGYGDLIERNLIEGIGALEGDTLPWTNEPEIILTESYKLSYEGAVMDLSSDGRVIRTGPPQAWGGRGGDVVSLLEGPAAGEWRRLVQAIDTSTFLVDPPIPAGTTAVSISAGFVAEVFKDNRIDIRGSRKSVGLVLVGNHFGTRVVKNHLVGGDMVFKLTACPTESPMIWGWTHAPFLGGVIEGNIIEDCERGGVLGVEHNPAYVKANKGRTYMTAQVTHNVVRWSEPFLRRVTAERGKLAGLTIGYASSHDPGELVVRAGGNRLEAPTVFDRLPTLVVEAAKFNSQRLVNRRYRLPQSQSGPTGVSREANRRTPESPH